MGAGHVKILDAYTHLSGSETEESTEGFERAVHLMIEDEPWE